MGPARRLIITSDVTSEVSNTDEQRITQAFGKGALRFKSVEAKATAGAVCRSVSHPSEFRCCRLRDGKHISSGTVEMPTSQGDGNVFSPSRRGLLKHYRLVGMLGGGLFVVTVATAGFAVFTGASAFLSRPSSSRQDK